MALQAGTWRDQPPPRYVAEVTRIVVYTSYPEIAAVCGRPRDDIRGCYNGYIYLPVECSPTRRPLRQFETIRPNELGRGYCDSLRRHELGHANGWPADHPRH